MHDNIPERFFSTREVADLRALPLETQPLVFFDYWTLKEAYIKAKARWTAVHNRALSQYARLAAAGDIATAEARLAEAGSDLKHRRMVALAPGRD